MKKTITRNKWFWVVLVVVALAALGNIIGLYEDNKEPTTNTPVSSVPEQPENKSEEASEDFYGDKFPDIPIAKSFKESLEKLDISFKDLLNKELNKNWITFAGIEGRESGKELTITVFIDDNVDLRAGNVQTIRNIAVNLVQEAGLLKSEKIIRDVKVKIKWGLELYQYTFELGKGWDKEVQ